ncbi:hypothetical protein [Thermoflexibacter ruber]|uniref:Uncharacterized protein n=1 Tax=Thermoflexibacter ruber TaxID=1003 RepID=A0A1I2JGH3_9BACT|nr:hypothetical protein [Thermoflexibacter ruber]SFF51956.1 hypothetical protein SAMN04488541_104631 [Thermoflexibacter ruber]
MKYYKMDYSLEDKEVGTMTDTQIKKFSQFWWDAPSDDTFPEGTDAGVFEVNYRAKLTDALSPFESNRAFILSGKFKRLLDECNLATSRFYNASIIYRKQQFDDYYYMHIVWDFTKYLNYQHSKFEIWQRNFNSVKEGEILFSSKADLDAKWEEFRAIGKEPPYEMPFIKYAKVVFNSDFDLDLFPVWIDFYISEKLCELIEKNKITGIEITPADFISRL